MHGHLRRCPLFTSAATPSPTGGTPYARTQLRPAPGIVTEQCFTLRMTSRFSTVAIIGAVLALASTSLLVLFRLYDDGVPIQLMRTLRFYDIDVIPVIGIAHLVAIVLAVFALARPTTVPRSILTIVGALFTIASSLVAYSALYTLYWSTIELLCYPRYACNPEPGETIRTHLLAFFGLFAVAVVITAILNRHATPRDTALRIGLLLLSALPFLTVLGLAGTLVLTRRDIAASAHEVEREVVDA